MCLLTSPNDMAIAENYRRWATHPLCQPITAVKNERVFEVDPVSWMMGGGILAANAMLDDLYEHYELTCRTFLPNHEEEPEC